MVPAARAGPACGRGELPPDQRPRARTLGLPLALIMLLLSLSWIVKLADPLVTVLGQRSPGGTSSSVASSSSRRRRSRSTNAWRGRRIKQRKVAATFGAVIVQIILLDIVFSLDEVIPAVGMVDQLAVMIAAVVVSVGIMLVSAGPIGEFVERHPTVKMLALSFLLLVGMSGLVAEGFHQHIPKGSIYGPIAFSLLVEALNLRASAVAARKKEAAKEAVPEPVNLRTPYVGDTPVG